MERSDPNHKPVADADVAKSEQPKPAPESAAVPDSAEPIASEADAQRAHEPVTYDPIRLERVSFDPSEDYEREEVTTQPLWRTANAHPAQAAGLDPDADAAPPATQAPDTSAPVSVDALPPAPEHLWDDVPEDALEPTRPLHWAEPETSHTSVEDAGSSRDIDAPLRATAEPAPPAIASDVPTADARRDADFGTPELVELAREEPVQVEPVAPVIPVSPPAAARVLEPSPPPPAPPPSRLEPMRAAWSPTIEDVAQVAPARQPSTTEAPPARGRFRDLVQRAARFAAIAFVGWACAVVFLVLVFRFVNPPFSMLMALQWMTGTPIHHEWVPLERISPNLTRAVIVAEDGRFCQHWGVDFVEVAKAIERATDGYPRGASTITMQVAKNLFLLPIKSYLRKVIEVPLTFIIELVWPKWRILEVYLNIVEWGPGVFGAEAASQSHFGRSASRLSARQAAQLAVVLPNPIVRDAGSPGPRTAHRASVIQARAARTPEASSCIGQ